MQQIVPFFGATTALRITARPRAIPNDNSTLENFGLTDWTHMR